MIFHLYCGKGGVGKTTLAAAAARRQATLGRRVLVVSTDPAHSLGDALGMTLAGAPRRVPSRGGRLDAAEIDAEAALDRWLRGRRPAFERALLRGTLLDSQDVSRLLRLSWPGIDELVAFVEIDRLAARRTANGGHPDVIVVDTAPTGHTWRLLSAAETIGGVAGALDAMLDRDRAIAAAVGGRAVRDAADALVDELRAHAGRLAARLRDPHVTRIVWVTLAEPVAVAEAVDAVSWLRRRGVPLAEIVVNRSATASSSCRVCAARASLERKALAPLRRAIRGVKFSFVADRAPAAGGAPARSTEARRHPDVQALAPAGVKLLIIAGKGGVGKTTVASALAIAIAAAPERRRVLLLSVDPAHSLGDVLSTRLGDRPRRVRGVAGRLNAREVDAPAALAREQAALKSLVTESFSAGSRGIRVDLAQDRRVIERLLELTPPGVDEIVALLTIVDAIDPYDLIVLDTAPTGHALRLLSMPDVAEQWLSELMRLLLKYREVVGMGRFAEPILRLSRGVRRLSALLRDSARARVVAVTRAAELPRLETVRLMEALDDLGIGTLALVVNATTGLNKNCARCRLTHALETGELERLDRICASRSVRRRGAVNPGGPAGCDIIVAPLAVPPPCGPDRLASWIDEWRLG